jgi:hypothetical protein
MRWQENVEHTLTEKKLPTRSQKDRECLNSTKLHSFSLL